MSEPMRIGIVCEGPTDRIILDGLIGAFLDSDEYVLTEIQPPRTALLLPPGTATPNSGGVFGQFGGGWVGVRRWCEQATANQTPLSDHAVFLNNDIVIIHLDADVAREGAPAPQGLSRPCPPASDTVDAMRTELAALLGGPPLPAGLVFCIPADSTEAWVIASLAPQLADANLPWECYSKPEALLPVTRARRGGVGKSQESYRRHLADFINGWNNVLARCSEAVRFETEMRAALP